MSVIDKTAATAAPWPGRAAGWSAGAATSSAAVAAMRHLVATQIALEDEVEALRTALDSRTRTVIAQGALLARLDAQLQQARARNRRRTQALLACSRTLPSRYRPKTKAALQPPPPSRNGTAGAAGPW